MSGDKQKNSSSSRDTEEKGLYGFKLPAVKLTTTNWLSWSKMVSTRLKGYRRHHHLVADPPKPLTDEWEADDSLILSAMWDAMEAGVRDTVMQCSTARKCWQKLEMNYSGLTSLTHAYDVLQAYNRPSMGSKTHDEYWTGFQKSIEELEELFPLTDLETVRRHREQIHVMNYLSGLPDSFSQARPSVMSHPLARGNVVEAYKLLRDMYPTQFAAVTSVEPLEASALFTTQSRRDGRGGGGGRVGFHNRGKGRGGRGGDHTSKGDLGIECHYCHQKGHMKWDCPRARTARTPPSSAHVASTSNLFSGTLDEDETRMIQEHRAQSSLLSSTACIAQTGTWDEEDDWHRSSF